MRGVLAVALVGVTGCGLGLSGLGSDGLGGGIGGGGDASSMAEGGSGGSSGGSGGDDGAASDDGTTTHDAPVGSCVAGIPSGWSLVAYETSAASCPPGYGASHDLSSGATAAADACTCSACSTTSVPSCETGMFPTGFATQPNGSCSSQGTSLDANGGACTPMQGQLGAAFSASAPTLQGGSCTASAVGDTTKVSKTAVRYCDVPGSAAEGVCGGAPPSGFSACITTGGDTPCPVGAFTQRTVVADTETLVCGACSNCKVTGTCGNGQIQFFGDDHCGQPIAQLPCNGSCAPVGGQRNFGSYRFTALPNLSCSATLSGMPTIQSSGLHTVCCR